MIKYYGFYSQLIELIWRGYFLFVDVVAGKRATIRKKVMVANKNVDINYCFFL